MPPAVSWLIRHGQSTANAGLPSADYEEVPLTALGHRQAREVARRVERQPDLLIVSPFLRAKETAGPIRERWPGSLCEVWPIQELTYLSPERCRGTTPETAGRGSRPIGAVATPTISMARTPNPSPPS